MEPYWQTDAGTIYQGHVLNILKQLPDESVQCCVTSPPYWGLRDYGLPPQIWDVPAELESCMHEWGETINNHQRGKVGNNSTLEGGLQAGGDSRLQRSFSGQFCQMCGAWRGSLGLEPTPELYVKHIVDIFSQVKRVLRKDGTLWVNMGDSYASGKYKYYNSNGYDDPGWSNRQSKKPPPGLKPKDLCGIPWLVAFALRNDGWYLRSDIIWEKPNPMPESMKDRPTRAHEYLFLLSRSRKYFYDHDAIKEEHGYNRWTDNRKQDASVIDAVHHGEVGKTSMLRKGKLNHFPEGGRNKRSVWKTPDGWDTSVGEGGHGAIHKYGREKGKIPIKDEAVSARMCRGPGWRKKTKSGNLERKENQNPGANFGVSVPWEGNTANKRTVWTLPTMPFPDAHFATFPPKLIEPCILAGTSEKGCCAECGAPWERITKSKYAGNLDAPKAMQKKQAESMGGNKTVSGFAHVHATKESKTIGWQLTCKCKADVEPCMVLDMFIGAGTTGIVAHKYGRKFIGIDLSETYLKDIAIPRIEREMQQLKLFN